MVLSKKLCDWVLHTKELDRNMEQAFTVILRQADMYLRAKLEAIPSWDTMRKAYDLMILSRN